MCPCSGSCGAGLCGESLGLLAPKQPVPGGSTAAPAPQPLSKAGDTSVTACVRKGKMLPGKERESEGESKGESEGEIPFLRTQYLQEIDVEYTPPVCCTFICLFLIRVYYP